ncbi:hypothetical protein BDAP_000878 [Binucleata daphniae]
MIVLVFVFICYAAASTSDNNIKNALHNCFMNAVENIACKNEESGKCIDVYIQAQERSAFGDDVYELEYSRPCELICTKIAIASAFEKCFNMFFD